MNSDCESLMSRQEKQNELSDEDENPDINTGFVTLTKSLRNYQEKQIEISDDDESLDIDTGFVMDVMNRSWDQYYPNISRDRLSREVCLQKAIKNDTQFYNEEIKNHLITFGDDYPVYCRGKINDEYFVYRVVIHAALTNNLSGPHYVSIEDQSPFWVHSLTALRKKFLGFTDFVSFERSSFITWFTTEDLTPVRLKMIRQNIKVKMDILPTLIFTSPSHSYSYSNNHIHRQNSNTLSPRSQLQIKRMLFNIKQIHHRDGVYLPKLYFQFVCAFLAINY